MVAASAPATTPAHHFTSAALVAVDEHVSFTILAKMLPWILLAVAAGCAGAAGSRNAQNGQAMPT
eukprot:5199088-Alexandrium_andersonii.AAC.1